MILALDRPDHPEKLYVPLTSIRHFEKHTGQPVVVMTLIDGTVFTVTNLPKDIYAQVESQSRR